MDKILITESIRTQEDFFAAVGRSRGCQDNIPRSLDDLAACLKLYDISTIIAADFDMEDEARIPLRETLAAAGVKMLL